MDAKKKKVLFIIEATLKSGAGRCAVELIQRIKDSPDFEPIVVTQYSNDINEYCSENDVENYHTHYARTCSLGMGRLGWLIAFFMRPILNKISYYRLAKKIDFSKICLIHSNAISIDFGAYLHKKTGLPHIWHVRDFLIFEKKWDSLIWNLPSYMMKNSSKIITVSNSLKKIFVECGIIGQNIQTIYDGIDLPKNANNDCSKQDNNIINVACVGYICDLKGQEVLIDAIIRLPIEKRSAFKFFFWGEFDPRFKTHILNKVADNDLESMVFFCGFSKNVFDELRNMDVGVQPSHSEGFSRVTAEYMAAGVCPIAAKEGAIPELIQDHVNGLMYEDYNSKELADLLLYCYDNQDEMKLYGQKAKEKAWQYYDFEKNYNQILDVYRETAF